MPSRKELFLRQFDAYTLPYVVQFAQHLSEVKADVFMLMARKAACFVDCLAQLRLTSLNGLVTSDRVLDMDNTWLGGKRVVIVDDALVSGTTIYRTVNLLREAKVASIKTKVFCVDRTYWSRTLAEPDPPYVSFNDRETTAFCASIVEAMSLVPRPYSVDWPIYANIRIPIRDIHVLSSLIDWEAYDVTSAFQEDSGIFAITCEPAKNVKKAFDDSLGCDLSRHSQVFKVRVFGRRIKGARPIATCQVLPIVALDPLSNSEIEQLWRALMSSGPGLVDGSFASCFISTTSKLRLIQFVAAARLGQLWIDCLQKALTSNVSPQQNLANIRHLFPPLLADKVRRLSESRGRLFRSSGNIKPRSAWSAKDEIQLSFSCNDLWTIQARLSEPFRQLYRTKEVEARKLALQLGPAALADVRYKNIMNRLQNGFSLPEIRDLLAEIKDIANVPRIVSLFLDYATDRGIVVPITKANEDFVYRGYRHGEDVLFSETEERLCAIMLSELADASGRVDLPSIWVEKMIVLLIRIGLRKHLFDVWAGALAAEGTVGIRFSLHGAVVQAHAPTLYRYNPEGAITGLFEEAGVLSYNKEKFSYRVKSIPEGAPTKETAEIEARKLGRLFGFLLSAQSGAKLLSETDLTLLATCLHPYDMPGALAAEIDIFSRRWRWRIQRFRRKNLNASDAAGLVTDFRHDEAFLAINSGAWKYRSFYEDRPWKIIKRVEAEIRDPLYRQEWNLCWSTIGKQTLTAVEPGLASLVRRQGYWLFRCNIVVRLLEAALRFVAEDKGVPTLPSAEAVNCLSEALDYCDHLSSFLDAATGERFRVRIIEALNQAKLFKPQGNNLLSSAIEDVDLLISEARSLLDETEARANAFGRPRAITKFPHFLYIEFVPASRENEKIWDSISRIVEGIRIEAKKSSGGEDVARIDMIPKGQGGFEEGRWICANGNMARRWLFRLAKMILKTFSRQSRVTVFAQLSDDEQLMVGERTSEYKGELFWQRAGAILSDRSVEDLRIPLVVYTLANTLSVRSIRKEVRESVGDLLRSTGSVSSKTIERPFSALWSSLGFEFDDLSTVEGKRQRSSPENKEDLRRADIGILTIVTEEMIAVRKCLESLESDGDLKESQEKFGSRIFYEGKLPRKKGGFHRVVCSQALDQGNRSISLAYEAISQSYAPKILILLGIGGSIHKDVGLCDVVIATQVIYYELKKETAAGVVRRGEAYKIPANVMPHLNKFFVMHREPAIFTSSTGSFRDQFKVSRGPLGSGEAVVAFRDSDTRRWLQNFNDKVMVLETEGGGVASSFYEGETNPGPRPLAYLVIRGISDHADQDKDDRWRQPAADNAMHVVLEFASQLPDLGS